MAASMSCTQPVPTKLKVTHVEIESITTGIPSTSSATSTTSINSIICSPPYDLSHYNPVLLVPKRAPMKKSSLSPGLNASLQNTDSSSFSGNLSFNKKRHFFHKIFESLLWRHYSQHSTAQHLNKSNSHDTNTRTNEMPSRFSSLQVSRDAASQRTSSRARSSLRYKPSVVQSRDAEIEEEFRYNVYSTNSSFKRTFSISRPISVNGVLSGLAEFSVETASNPEEIGAEASSTVLIRRDTVNISRAICDEYGYQEELEAENNDDSDESRVSKYSNGNNYENSNTDGGTLGDEGYELEAVGIQNYLAQSFGDEEDDLENADPLFNQHHTSGNMEGRDLHSSNYVQEQHQLLLNTRNVHPTRRLLTAFQDNSEQEDRDQESLHEGQYSNFNQDPNHLISSKTQQGDMQVQILDCFEYVNRIEVFQTFNWKRREDFWLETSLLASSLLSKEFEPLVKYGSSLDGYVGCASLQTQKKELEEQQQEIQQDSNNESLPLNQKEEVQDQALNSTKFNMSDDDDGGSQRQRQFSPALEEDTGSCDKESIISQSSYNSIMPSPDHLLLSSTYLELSSTEKRLYSRFRRNFLLWRRIHREDKHIEGQRYNQEVRRL